MISSIPQRIFINDLLNHFKPNSKVLVIGAGGADYWRYIRNIPCNTVVVDRRNILDCTKLITHDVTSEFPFSCQEFDYVYISTVLEYVIDDLFVLRECFRVLKGNGILLVHSSFLPDRSNIPIRIYSLKTLKDICLYAQFEIRNFEFYGFFEYIFHKNLLTKYFFAFFAYFINSLDTWYLIKKISYKFSFLLRYKSYTDICLMSFKKSNKELFTYLKDK